MNARTITFHTLTFLMLCIGAVARAEEPNYIGKVVTIKTAKESTSCIRIENFVPEIGAFKHDAPGDCSFKVEAGTQPGTLLFRWVKDPTLYLQHRGFRLLLLNTDPADASFRVVHPLKGNEGLSLQAASWPTHHLCVVEKNQIFISPNIKDLRKAVFFIQEVTK